VSHLALGRREVTVLDRLLLKHIAQGHLRDNTTGEGCSNPTACYIVALMLKSRILLNHYMIHAAIKALHSQCSVVTRVLDAQ
jgi:hypothetical protein